MISPIRKEMYKITASSPEHSALIQKILFASGFDWSSAIQSTLNNQHEVKHIDHFENKFFLVFTDGSFLLETLDQYYNIPCEKLMILYKESQYTNKFINSLIDLNYNVVDGIGFEKAGTIQQFTKKNPFKEEDPNPFNRITKTEDLERGDLVFMLCVGDIKKVVITSNPYEEKAGDASKYSWRREYTSLSNTLYGYKNNFFEGDYGIGVKGVSLNGLFRTYEEAFKYSITDEYKKKLRQHQMVCEEIEFYF